MGRGKFYWLKLDKDFFKRHDIKIIESMPNGKDYILFYLKLLCESLDHDAGPVCAKLGCIKLKFVVVRADVFDNKTGAPFGTPLLREIPAFAGMTARVISSRACGTLAGCTLRIFRSRACP